MQISKLSLMLGAAVAVLAAGCAGPEQKLGRGLNNMTEFTRMGEMQRSVEQTALWYGPDKAYTTGVIHGFNRSVARTAVGIYEVATFPFPSYKPVIYPEGPVYPDNYTPSIIADPTLATDTDLSFSGGDIAPFVPGSRFSIFDN